MATTRTPQPGRTAGQLTRRHFIALEIDATLRDAETTMRLARVRTLPVLDDGRLRGLAEHRSLALALLDTCRGLREDGTTSDDPGPIQARFGREAQIAPDASLAEAAARLCRLGSGCLAVVEDRGGVERLLGVLTESDLLRAALARDT